MPGRHTTAATPHTLARQLAHIARQLHDVVTTALADEPPHGVLHQQYEAVRRTLLPALTPAAFADMYAQTLVYGLFAARVALPDSPTFTREQGVQALPHTLSLVPALFGQLDHAGLDERIPRLVDACAHLLQHTAIAPLLNDNDATSPAQRGDPVLHFYETFLTAYDPHIREIRGVYYTPEPVVGYIVRSVDHLLRTHFGKPAGLADGQTVVLDPATGTATFLHAIIQHIHTTVTRTQDSVGGIAGHWPHYVSETLLPRLHGIELLTAPCLIAHLKLHMLLQHTGYTLAPHEHTGLALANALADAPAAPNTPDVPDGQPAVPLARAVADVANRGEGAALVVVGNPPYANTGPRNQGTWIHTQLADYKRGLQEKKLNLDDDCIKFIRLGQWCVEQAGQGILAFITSNTWIDGITYRRMRESLRETFSHIYVLDLHGSSLKQEVCPDGSHDNNVFDIRQGVAIVLMVREPHAPMPTDTPTVTRRPASVQFADVWGTRAQKYAYLDKQSVATTAWESLSPEPSWYFFVPRHFEHADEYNTFPSITDIFEVYQNSIKTDRDSLFVARDAAELHERLATFYSDAGVQSPFRETYRVYDTSSYRILTRRARTTFNPDHIQRMLYRPFDVRWCYYAPGITSRPAWRVMRHMLAGPNIALVGMRQYEYDVPDYCYTFVTEHITESRVFISNRGGASLFPLYCYPTEAGGDAASTRRPNFAPAFVHALSQRLGLVFLPDGAGDLVSTFGPEDVFHYLYAVLHCPTYRTRYAEQLRIDYPRVPMPHDRAHFAALASPGARLLDLHLLRMPGCGGVGGAGGVASLHQPGAGAQGVWQQGLTDTPINAVRYDPQQECVRVHHHAHAACGGIAPETWSLHIGGYQPLDRWLKERKGDTLSPDAVLHLQRMVVALRETRLVMAEIDRLYNEPGSV